MWIYFASAFRKLLSSSSLLFIKWLEYLIRKDFVFERGDTWKLANHEQSGSESIARKIFQDVQEHCATFRTWKSAIAARSSEILVEHHNVVDADPDHHSHLEHCLRDDSLAASSESNAGGTSRSSSTGRLATLQTPILRLSFLCLPVSFRFVASQFNGNLRLSLTLTTHIILLLLCNETILNW